METEKDYLNKEEFVKVFRHKIDERDGYMNQEMATEVLNIVLECIVDTVKNGKGISFVNFGKFQIRERASRKGRNPQTGEEITIPKRKSIAFTAGKELKDAVPQEKKQKKNKKKK